MGHHLPVTVEMGRRNCIFARGPCVKHRARLKRRNRNGRFQETQFGPAPRQGGGLFIHRYQGNPPPEAPRNTTSYIIRAKSMGDAPAPVVTPSPFTPTIMLTPGPFPRYKEQFADEAKKWGVNGYGSMNGLIRMKTREVGALVVGENEDDKAEEEEGEEENEGHYVHSLQQLEQRLDQGLNRFEMVYPYFIDVKQAPPLQVLLVDQERDIAQLERENIILRERLSSIERELDDLRSRIQELEGGSEWHQSGEVVSEKSIGTGYPRNF